MPARPSRPVVGRYKGDRCQPAVDPAHDVAIGEIAQEKEETVCGQV
jgi:hypothetical protein